MKGYKLPFSATPCQFSIPLNKLKGKEALEMHAAISHLLDINAVTECQPCNNQFLSHIFLAPKPNGDKRFILNLKCLNKFITTSHFKLEDIRTATKLLSAKCVMIKIDLKEAYFSVSIHKNYRQYLRFQWQNKLYQFKVLPFGLCTAPYVFTKLMKPVIEHLRCQGITCTVYLDDILLIFDNHTEANQGTKIAINLLEYLGFTINYNKCILTPAQKCQFLGFVLNSLNMTIELPIEKCKKVRQELLAFYNKRECKIREFAHLLGLLTSICPAVKYGWVYTKALERTKYLNLLNNDDYNRIMKLPYSLRSDFEWWFENIKTPSNNIRSDHYELEIFSDSSLTGWGVACNDNSLGGPWTLEESKKHINYLELLAAFIGLKTYAVNYRNCQILLRIDNTTAISYINRMGGVQFIHLNSLAKEIWQWCEKRGIFIFASYIQSKENYIADAESRKAQPNIEFELADYAFQQIISTFGKPEIDLFASRVNKKCDKFISWKNDPDAIAIDAFTVSWADYFFYAFPPFSMLLKTLRKIINEKATGIVVAPYWPTQAWYTMFKKSLISEPIYFQPNKTLLTSINSLPHPLHERLTLVAGISSGKH